MSNKAKPLVSVLMLSYNHAEFIAAAVRSVFKQKNDIVDVELLVIDDGSTDGSVAILEELKADANIRMKVIANQHEGVVAIAKNFNALIRLANGGYITFLASDDEYIENRFIEQISLFESNSDLEIIYGNGIDKKDGELLARVVGDAMVSRMSTLSSCDIFDYLGSNVPHLYIQGVLVKKTFLESFEVFDEDLIADDWVFNIRSFKMLCEKNKKFLFLDNILFVRNILPGSTSSNHPVQMKRILQVIDKYTPALVKRDFKARIYFAYLMISIKSVDAKFFIRCMFGYVRSDLLMKALLALLAKKIKGYVFLRRL